MQHRTLHAGHRHHATGLFKHLIGAIQLTNIAFNGSINLAQLLTQLAARTVLGLRVHRFEPAAVNSNKFAVQQIDVSA